MTFEQQLELYLRARCTLLVLVTPEEDRALQAVRAVCDNLRRSCLSWDIAEHFQAVTPGAAPLTARDPLAALALILNQARPQDRNLLPIARHAHNCRDGRADPGHLLLKQSHWLDLVRSGGE